MPRRRTVVCGRYRVRTRPTYTNGLFVTCRTTTTSVQGKSLKPFSRERFQNTNIRCMCRYPSRNVSSTIQFCKVYTIQTRILKLIDYINIIKYKLINFFVAGLVLIHGRVVHKSEQNKSQCSRHAYAFHVFDEGISRYSEQNWLQTKVGFKPLF